jgi:F-type H+-transporting ATPase subunit b
MNGLIDVKLLLTQVLGFLLLVWILGRYAWGPIVAQLEARRQKIAGEFADAERRKAEADQLRLKYEQELRSIEAQARQKINEGIAEGQRVAGEIKTQAQQDAALKLQQADDDVMRRREQAKEILKEQMIALSLRAAEKVIRRELDDAGHRKLVGEFLDEASNLK